MSRPLALPSQHCCEMLWRPLPAFSLPTPPPPTLGDVLNQFKLCPLMRSDKLKSLDPLTPSTLLNTRIHIIYFFFCDNKHEYPYNYALEMLQPFDPVCSQHLSQLSSHECWKNVATIWLGRDVVHWSLPSPCTASSQVFSVNREL